MFTGESWMLFKLFQMTASLYGKLNAALSSILIFKPQSVLVEQYIN